MASNKELQNLLKEMDNPHYKVALVLNESKGRVGKKTITGFLVDDLSLRFESQYGSLSQVFDIQQLNTYLGVIQGLIPTSDRQYAILTFYSTIQYWTGYSPIELHLDMVYPVFDSNSYNRYKENIKTILESIVPDTSSGNFTVVAPNEYSPHSIRGISGGHPKGTWNLAVGQWLLIPGLLITGADVSFSRQAVHPSKSSAHSVPQVARVGLNLRSWRLHTAQEILSFFKL